MILALQQSHSALAPSSPEAGAIAGLWWAMLAIGGAIWVAVMVCAVYVTRNKPEATDDGATPAPVDAAHARRMTRVVSIATAATVLVLLVFLSLDFAVGRKLTPSALASVSIDVVGHQWWWEFTYNNADPSRIVSTANELHIPVGTPVRFTLKAYDVIHSFWLPSMNGKRDLIPGHENIVQFQADTVGTYRGQCAEFCGLQHANMAFIVVAEPQAAFDRWLAAQRQPSASADSTNTAEGREVFLSRSCATCHTIRGTLASARVAPDLTHFASHLTLAAGTTANTPAALARWIVVPDSIKPGTQMPSTPLSPQELRALVAYLETLR